MGYRMNKIVYAIRNYKGRYFNFDSKPNWEWVDSVYQATLYQNKNDALNDCDVDETVVKLQVTITEIEE